MARNILVVEDDRNISDLIRMYLEKEGFDVRIAYDGGKAVEEYDRQAPDMVLLDIMLPVMDGWAVCAKIRETSKVPIIMLTAKGEVFDRIQGLEMGADDYVAKPFRPRELVARIHAAGQTFVTLSGSAALAAPVQADYLLASPARPDCVKYDAILSLSSDYRWMPEALSSGQLCHSFSRAE